MSEPQEAWPNAPPSPQDLPEGEYVAAYKGSRRAVYFGQSKIELIFEIVEPCALASVALPLYATMPSGRLSSATSITRSGVGPMAARRDGVTV